MEEPQEAFELYAEGKLGRADWHDAGYDAAAALLSWECFKMLARGEQP